MTDNCDTVTGNLPKKENPLRTREAAPAPEAAQAHAHAPAREGTTQPSDKIQQTTTPPSVSQLTQGIVNKQKVTHDDQRTLAGLMQVEGMQRLGGGWLEHAKMMGKKLGLTDDQVQRQVNRFEEFFINGKGKDFKTVDWYAQLTKWLKNAQQK